MILEECEYDDRNEMEMGVIPLFIEGQRGRKPLIESATNSKMRCGRTSTTTSTDSRAKNSLLDTHAVSRELMVWGLEGGWGAAVGHWKLPLH